ncbi:MAG: AraC family transcriptional regulator [Bacteroidota bacterium]
MRDYNKIIDSLAVQCIKARHIRVLQALTIDSFYDVENIVILPNKGTISYTQAGAQQQVAPGEMLFIPGGQPITITYGRNNPLQLDQEAFTDDHQRYFQAMAAPDLEGQLENFSYITFEAKLLEAVNFFTSLAIPPFIIKDNAHLSNTLKSILLESSAATIGNARMVQTYTEQLVIEIVRHLIANHLFTDNLITHSHYFKDPRLIKLLHYIRDNLGGNLSNRKLAAVAHVSEDYVGQYFKMLIGINPQDYIEFQRMERAVKLLSTTQKSIRDIGQEVGFKDTAYFCRRFRMRFGIPAGKMRRKASFSI